jgi:SAM-dependent methyltransferase
MRKLVLTSPQEMRRMRIISGVDLDSSGLEYGPLHNAIVLKDECRDIRFVDFKTREELVAQYSNDPNVDVSLIPDIDIVTNGRPINEFVADNGIDFIIASHVLEHVPDLIGWLEANLRLLRTGGRIALAFPDRRFCFDLTKQATSFHELVAAYFEKRTQPNFTQICDQVINSRKATPTEVWSGTISAVNAPRVIDLPGAISVLRRLVDKKEYRDVHCWKFSDTEFMETVDMIKSQFQLPFEILNHYPTRLNTAEFYATLIKV